MNQIEAYTRAVDAALKAGNATEECYFPVNP